MARPIKEGLDYFPLDCDIDEKLEALEAEFGIEGFGIWVRILQAIYRTSSGEFNLEGEFSGWKILGKRTGKSPENLRKIIAYMTKIKLLDKDAFKNRKVLTSNGVKKRLIHIQNDRKRDRERKSIP